MVTNQVEIMADQARLEKIASARKKVRYYFVLQVFNFENTVINVRVIGGRSSMFLTRMATSLFIAEEIPTKESSVFYSTQVADQCSR